jgi:cytochrome c biogenesis protein CcdA
VGGINPWVLMLVYAASVTVGLVGITVGILAVGKGLEEKIRRHESLLPKISGIVLIILAVSLLMGLWI